METVEAKGLPRSDPPVSFIPRDDQGNTIDFAGVDAQISKAFITSVLVYAAMQYRAKKISEPPLMVVQESDEGDDWLKDHELAPLLQYPNADEEMADLLEATSYAMDRTGMALWVIDRAAANAPARLALFGGDEFTVRKANGRLYGAFTVTTEPGPASPQGKREFGPDDVIFYRFTHPLDRWRGLAPLEVVARQLRVEARLLRAMLAGIDNAWVPGLSIVFPKEVQINPKQQEELKDYISVNYAAARNHGKAFVTGGGPQIVQTKMGFQGLEGGNLYREIEAAVCITFGVRPEIIGMMIGLENAPWSHMSTAQRLSYDETIVPLWRRYERGLTRQLLRQVDEDPQHHIQFDTTDVRALREDEEKNARISVLLRDISTRNQRRRIAGLSAEKGPMNGDPLFWDSVQVQTQAPQGGSSADGGASVAAQDASAANAEARGKSSPERALRHKLWNADVQGQEVAWTAAVMQQLDADKAAVLDMARLYLRESKGQTKVADADSITRFLRVLFGDQKMAAEWSSRIGSLVVATASHAVQQVGPTVGISFDLLLPGVKEYARTHAAHLIQQVTQTTKEQVRQAVEVGLEKGEGAAEIATRIKESGAFMPSRALRIARTETTGISNGAAQASLSKWAAENNAHVIKGWLATPDDPKTRDSHAEIDGEEVDIDATFSNGCTAPGVGGEAKEVVNCRCALTYRIARGTKAAPAPAVKTHRRRLRPLSVNVHVAPPANGHGRTTKTVRIVDENGRVTREGTVEVDDA